MVVESENTCQGILASATGKKAAAEVGSVARSAVSSLGRMYSVMCAKSAPVHPQVTRGAGHSFYSLNCHPRVFFSVSSQGSTGRTVH